jgi:hypothetical protein
MKKYLTVLSLAFSLIVYGQAPPQGINYQAVARNSSGNPLISASLSVQFSIWDAATGGSMLFTETHSGISTNVYGLFTSVIGSVNTGSFSSINWAAGTRFLEVSVDDGSGMVSMGRLQMQSVPYALYAATAGGGLTGATGATGAPSTVAGPTGATGNIGVTGATGAPSTVAGPNGATGDTGATGSTGVTGATGAGIISIIDNGNGTLDIVYASGTLTTGILYGPTGNSGTTGATGNNGADGSTGATGNNGIDGATGTPGVVGATGATGNNGIDGVTGATGGPGATGATGSNGIDGATGATGLAGATGATGTNGATGTDGATGATGTGLTGNTGVTGPTGGTGSNGTNGSTGITGSTGLSVLNGVANPTAGVGNNGEFYINTSTNTIFGPKSGGTWPGPGVSLVGPAGSTGVTGPTGTGVTGPTGGTGTNGTNGATGATGAANIAGTVNTIIKFTGAATGGNSQLFDDGTNVGVGTGSPAFKLDVAGAGRYTGTLKVGAYTLPSTDGTASQVLKTNGSGILTWSADNAGTGTVTSVTALSPLASTGGTTPALSITQATSTANGFLSSADWNTFNGKIGGSGSTNTVPFWSSVSTLGTSVIKADASNVAIGTPISTNYIFQVNQNSPFPAVYAQNSGAGGTGVWGYSSNATSGEGVRGVAVGAGKGVYGMSSGASGYAGYFENTAGGTAASFIGGNVGIATPSPGALLDVGPSPTALSMRITNTNTSSGTAAYLNNTSASNLSPALQVQVSNPSAPSALFLGGNVGVGTNTPGSPLDVVGAINATSGYLVGSAPSASGNYLRSNGTLFVSASPSQMYTDLQPFLSSGSDAWSRSAPNVTLTTPSDNVGIGVTPSGSKLQVMQSTTGGNAGYFSVNNTSNSGGYALDVFSNGQNTVMRVINSGTSTGTFLYTTNTSNTNPVLYAKTDGAGQAGSFEIANASSNSPSVYITNNGNGEGISVFNTGTGKAALVQQNSTSNTSQAFEATTYGLGKAGLFTISNAGSSANTVEASTNGSGYAGAFFGGAFVRGKGTGSGITFRTENASGTVSLTSLDNGNVGVGVSPSFRLDVNGTTNTLGFRMPVAPANAKILTSDAAGNGSWQYPATYSAFSVPVLTLATITSSSAPLGNIAAFTKTNAASVIDLVFNGHVSVGSFGSSSGIVLELRVDGSPTGFGNAQAVVWSADAGRPVNLTIVGAFKNLSSGSHTVSLWASVPSGGGAVSLFVNPGNWSDQLIVKEVLGN